MAYYMDKDRKTPTSPNEKLMGGGLLKIKKPQ